mmetsp:Transcript_118174/g.294791  ORF Transcript_118174/g.294791 Transcript_118174/m.294791 type:complete len:306 (-) Transcript_118174:1348-2265(-)
MQQRCHGDALRGHVCHLTLHRQRPALDSETAKACSCSCSCTSRNSLKHGFGCAHAAGRWMARVDPTGTPVPAAATRLRAAVGLGIRAGASRDASSRPAEDLDSLVVGHREEGCWAEGLYSHPLLDLPGRVDPAEGCFPADHVVAAAVAPCPVVVGGHRSQAVAKGSQGVAVRGASRPEAPCQVVVGPAVLASRLAVLAGSRAPCLEAEGQANHQVVHEASLPEGPGRVAYPCLDVAVRCPAAAAWGTPVGPCLEAAVPSQVVCPSQGEACPCPEVAPYQVEAWMLTSCLDHVACFRQSQHESSTH